MKHLKKLTLILFAVAAVCVLAGILLFVLAVPGASSTFYRVCFILIAIFSVLVGVGLLFLLYISRDSEPNFFLYDTKSARNMAVEDLTFERVNSRMSYFMSTLSTSQDRLWNDNVLAQNPAKFGVREIYKPLAAYKMLYDLAEIDRPEGWALFLCAPTATIDQLLTALRDAGEDDMLARIRNAYNTATGREDYEWIRDYITGNQKYIRHKMMVYVQKNIEWFY